MGFEYIPIPTAIILSNKTSLIAHYGRLRALAWQNAFDHTDPIPEDQLYSWLGLERRQFFNVISLLKDAGWITIERSDKTKVKVFFPVQLIAQESLVKLVSLIEEGTELRSAKLDFSAINCTKSAIDCTESAINCTEQLIKLGVNKTIAQALADEYPAEFIQDKIKVYEWAVKAGTAKGAGYLVRSIQQKWEVPSAFEIQVPKKQHTQLIIPEHEAPEMKEEEEEEEALETSLDNIPGTNITPQEAWDKLCTSMTDIRGGYDLTLKRYMQGTKALGFEEDTFIIVTSSEQSAQFLQYRAIFELQKLIIGILRKPAQFKFIYNKPEEKIK